MCVEQRNLPPRIVSSDRISKSLPEICRSARVRCVRVTLARVRRSSEENAGRLNDDNDDGVLLGRDWRNIPRLEGCRLVLVDVEAVQLRTVQNLRCSTV